MALSSFLSLLFIHITLFVSLCFAGDPFVNYEFVVSYITASPLGVPQQVFPSDLFLSLEYILSLTAFSYIFHVGLFNFHKWQMGWLYIY